MALVDEYIGGIVKNRNDETVNFPVDNPVLYQVGDVKYWKVWIPSRWDACFTVYERDGYYVEEVKPSIKQQIADFPVGTRFKVDTERSWYYVKIAEDTLAYVNPNEPEYNSLGDVDRYFKGFSSELVIVK